MRPALLSKESSTDARPTGLRSPAPLKITSCIDSPRSAEAFDSPSTQRTASMTLDLPQPLGPTMPTADGRRARRPPAVRATRAEWTGALDRLRLLTGCQEGEILNLNPHEQQS